MSRGLGLLAVLALLACGSPDTGSEGGAPGGGGPVARARPVELAVPEEPVAPEERAGRVAREAPEGARPTAAS